MSARISRRRFGQGLGALTIAFSLIPPSLAADAPKLPGDLATTPFLDAWLRINADGTVTVLAGKVELGQGILTAFEQIVADELEIDPARIRIISGDTAQTPDEAFTSGSQSMEYGGTALRHACAEARQIFIRLAMERFGVHDYQVVGNTKLDLTGGESVLSFDDGSIQIGSSGRKVTYWELAGEIDLHREATGTAPLKQPAALRYIGKNRPRRDIPAKVTGGAAYVQDIRLPGMLYGRISRPPSYAAQLTDFDEARVKQLPGVVAVVRDGRFLGVVAEREEWAIAARDELARVGKWHEEAQFPAASDIYKYLKSLPAEDHVIADKGEGAAPAARVSLSGSFTRPYTAHASIGPSCAVAQLKDGELTVWTHSQGVFPLQRDLAKALDMELAKSAASMPKARAATAITAPTTWRSTPRSWRAPPGRPVRCSGCARRVRLGAFRPGDEHRSRAGLDEVGTIVDWEHHVWSNTHSTRPQNAGASRRRLASGAP